MNGKFDILLRGGRVIDPANGIDGVMGVAIKAGKIAADFTAHCIENTYRNPAHWYGVKFETALPELLKAFRSR